MINNYIETRKKEKAVEQAANEALADMEGPCCVCVQTINNNGPGGFQFGNVTNIEKGPCTPELRKEKYEEFENTDFIGLPGNTPSMSLSEKCKGSK